MKPVIGLDRDGVINVDLWDYCYRVEDFRPIPGSLEAIARLKQAGYSVVIITNQSGVGQGLYTEDDINLVHDYMLDLLKQEGCPAIDDIFYSINKNDFYSKPNVGLFRQCEKKHLDIQFNRGYFVGDKITDMQAAQNVGAKPILVRTGYGLYTEANMPLDGITVYNRLSDFVDDLLK